MTKILYKRSCLSNQLRDLQPAESVGMQLVSKLLSTVTKTVFAVHVISGQQKLL